MPNTMVNGFAIREAIKKWELRRDTAASQFEPSLTKFPGEEKPAPDAVAADFLTAEESIAALQAAQSRYNLAVTVDVDTLPMSLCSAVKRLGGAGRLERMWRDAAGLKKEKRNRYLYERPAGIRKADELYPEATLTTAQAVERATKAARFAGALRAAIAQGNGTAVLAESIGLNPSLLTE